MKINIANFSEFIVTGTEVRGKRFRHRYTNAMYAFGINLWRGSVWGIRRDNGRRQLLKRVVN